MGSSAYFPPTKVVNPEGKDLTIDFNCKAVISIKQFKSMGKGAVPTYTNLNCNLCGEWWIVMCVADKKEMYCTWCGAICRLEEMGK